MAGQFRKMNIYEKLLGVWIFIMIGVVMRFNVHIKGSVDSNNEDGIALLCYLICFAVFLFLAANIVNIINQERRIIMPPSGFSKKTIEGLLLFVQGNYEDLLAEVESGKHADVPSAIRFEIDNLEKALAKLHIDENGDLVERK